MIMDHISHEFTRFKPMWHSIFTTKILPTPSQEYGPSMATSKNTQPIIATLKNFKEHKIKGIINNKHGNKMNMMIKVKQKQKNQNLKQRRASWIYPNLHRDWLGWGKVVNMVRRFPVCFGISSRKEEEERPKKSIKRYREMMERERERAIYRIET